MQLSSAFDQTKSLMLKMDSLIQEVASQGKGSRRSLYMTIGAGTLQMNDTTDTIKWVLETDAMMVSPRSMQRAGNLIIGSNLDTMAFSGSYGGQPSYVLENENLKVFIKRIGSQQSPQSYDTGQLLQAVYNKKLLQWMPLEKLEISIDQSQNSTAGTGYTELAAEGYALPGGEVLAHINTSYQYLNNYTITFALESGADFLTIGANS
jgi:hypothetical protein